MTGIKKYIIEFKGIIKNFLYNLSYQVLALLLPIITVPYITRIFDQDIIGMNSVVQANCYYFVLFGMLGIDLLGPSEIAKCLGDTNMLKDKFFNIYSVQFFSHLIIILVYVNYCYFTRQSFLAYIYLLYPLSTMFDISWFFVGIEDFKSVSFRNLTIKVISFVLLFILVHSNRDIYVYVCTLYIPQLLINIYMWCVLVKKYTYGINFIFPRRKYLIMALSMFIPQVASSIYTVLDKTVLGIFTTYTIVAIYTQGQTVLRLFLAIVPCFSRVLSPRISSYIAKKDKKNIDKYMKMSGTVVSCISSLLFFGTLVCADLFVGWYLPVGYELTSVILRLCSPIILMVSGANLIAVQYLIPLGEQNKYTISVIASSIVNLIFNFILAPIIGIYGVCIGSVVAETVGFLIQLHFANKTLDLKNVFSVTPLFLIAGLIMMLFGNGVVKYFNPSFVSLFLLVVVLTIVYFVVIATYVCVIKK